MAHTPNPFEAENRLRKAIVLADALDGAGLCADAVTAMDETEWNLAAAAAGTRAPSQQTCQLIIWLLCRRECARKTFGGRKGFITAA